VARVTYDKELTALLVIDPYEEMHAVLDLNIPNYGVFVRWIGAFVKGSAR
jgi:hypothetical protein